jgi:predicted flavoprotein YhiN
LPPAAIGLLQEAAAHETVRLADLSSEKLAERINHFPMVLSGVGPVETAISTAGGIAFSELDGNFMLNRLPGVFAAGEMLDWEAPTGGYLLQASFATGVAAGKGAVRWLGVK